MDSNISPDSLFKSALQLSEEQRATLAAMLIESLQEETDDEIQSAWRLELQKRVHDLRSGVVQAVPWEKTRGKLGLADE
ncbi:MAG: addiction module protein [Pirellulales bacterium]|nr:addiction module protein [Pirellulales bacterium]